LTTRRARSRPRTFFLPIIRRPVVSLLWLTVEHPVSFNITGQVIQSTIGCGIYPTMPLPSSWDDTCGVNNQQPISRPMLIIGFPNTGPSQLYPLAGNPPNKRP
jgi:hypothetical protein